MPPRRTSPPGWLWFMRIGRGYEREISGIIVGIVTGGIPAGFAFVTLVGRSSAGVAGHSLRDNRFRCTSPLDLLQSQGRN